MHIFKFGGASVKNAEAVRNLKTIIQKFKNGPLVVVVSAMDKTTNQLENLLNLALKGNDYVNELHDLESFHRNIAQELFGHSCEKSESYLNELTQTLPTIKDQTWINSYDKIVPFGELLSTSIIAEFLSKDVQVQWIDARTIIKTDEFNTEANILWEETESKVKANLLPALGEFTVITQGFIGSTLGGQNTTLGREGSDFTGAILANCLDAHNFTVWKDVPGILNADPKLKADAEQFAHISYREVTEMTYYGAQVIHPKTLKPLAQKNIPLIVRSFKQHDAPGTLISSEHAEKIIPTYIYKENQLLITAEVRDHSFMDEKRLAIILDALDQLNVKINLMQNSALTFSFCMDNKSHKLDPILSALSNQFTITYNQPLKLATVKNYTADALAKLPVMKEVLLIQKTRTNYQVLYR